MAIYPADENLGQRALFTGKQYFSSLTTRSFTTTSFSLFFPSELKPSKEQKKNARIERSIKRTQAIHLSIGSLRYIFNYFEDLS
jgi:hypothetical protein